MIKDVLTIKEKVELLLSKYPETRDSDKLLWLAFMVTYHNLKSTMNEETYIRFKTLLLNNDTPVMESVRRVRQKFQENGKYPPTNKTAQARNEEQTAMRGWALE